MKYNLQLRGQILRDLNQFEALTQNNSTYGKISGNLRLDYKSENYQSNIVKGSITNEEFNDVLESIENYRRVDNIFELESGVQIQLILN